MKKYLFFGEKREIGKYEYIFRFIVLMIINSYIFISMSYGFSKKDYVILIVLIILGFANLSLVALVEKDAFFRVGDRKKRFIVTSISQIMILSLILSIAFVIMYNHVNYNDYSILKSEVNAYLADKYDREFVVKDDIEKRKSLYHLKCYPKDNPEIEFLTIWKKGDLKKSRDTYLNYKWNYQAEPEATMVIEDYYGEDALIHFQFWTTNDGLMDITDEVKHMDYEEVIRKYKDKVSIDIHCYTFSSGLDQKKESERAYQVIENYLRKNAGDGMFHIYFFAEDHKEELMRQYEADNGFFWIKGTSDFTKMYKKGELLNILHLTPGIEKEEIGNHFYYK